MMMKLTKKFLICGTIGWCTEILFTSFQSFRSRDWRLLGQTSLWMFPIYGCGCLLTLPYHYLKHRSFWIRGFTYMTAIFTGEYLSGKLLAHYNACPWNYAGCRLNLGKVIRLDYAPGWFLLGLFLENIHKK